jgi:hypothetical protein
VVSFLLAYLQIFADEEIKDKKEWVIEIRTKNGYKSTKTTNDPANELH